MAKIYERVLSTNILLGEDSICMVNLLETPGVIFFFIT